MSSATSTLPTYDVVIVGAGPAGLSTALHLAKIAPGLVARTLILEKAHHPRPKLCGGGLLPDGERILQDLGLNITEIPHTNVHMAHFHFAGSGMQMRPEDSLPFAFRTLHRPQFDAWLAQKAIACGFTLLQDTQVLSVSPPGPHGLTLQTTRGPIQARVVVAANGSNSRLRQAVNPHEKGHLARLLEVTTPPTPHLSPNIQTDSYFDFLVVPHGIQGYLWDFPAQRNGQPVRVRGVYDSNVHSPRRRVSLPLALTAELERHGLRLSDYELQGFPIRWFSARSAFAAPHLLLVGDAAGSDALIGEGISIALGYGALAAQAIHHAFSSQDYSFRTYKRLLLNSQMGHSLRWRTFLAHILYRLSAPLFQAFFWRCLGWAIEIVVKSAIIGWAHRQQSRPGGLLPPPIK